VAARRAAGPRGRRPWRRGGIQSDVRAHLEIFADRQVVIVPGGIGVSGGRTEFYGSVTDALWTAPAWTLQPGGVIQLTKPGMRLGEFFAMAPGYETPEQVAARKAADDYWAKV
jgi:hypothetical protein